MFRSLELSLHGAYARSQSLKELFDFHEQMLLGCDLGAVAQQVLGRAPAVECFIFVAGGVFQVSQIAEQATETDHHSCIQAPQLTSFGNAFFENFAGFFGIARATDTICQAAVGTQQFTGGVADGGSDVVGREVVLLGQSSVEDGLVCLQGFGVEFFGLVKPLRCVEKAGGKAIFDRAGQAHAVQGGPAALGKGGQVFFRGFVIALGFGVGVERTADLGKAQPDTHPLGGCLLGFVQLGIVGFDFLEHFLDELVELGCGSQRTHNLALREQHVVKQNIPCCSQLLFCCRLGGGFLRHRCLHLLGC